MIYGRITEVYFSMITGHGTRIEKQRKLHNRKDR